MDLKEELDLYLRSRFSLVCLATFEEEHVLRLLRELCTETGRTLYQWDQADFFERICGDGGAPPVAKDALSALEAIEKKEGEVVFVLRDFHQCCTNQGRVVRKLRSLAQKLKYTKKTVFMVQPTAALPDELKDDCVVLDVAPPGYEELKKILARLLNTPGAKHELNPESADRIIRAALGLSSTQAQRVFSKAIVTDGALREDDLDLINAEKKQLIRESSALEFHTPSAGMGEIGGLEALKEWLSLRSKAFSREAQAYGLPAPKGIALIGIPGTGKSLTAKTVANAWRVPLLRLDVGALYGSLVGESESNARRSLRLAEACAPCVLWIDELEKGLSFGGGDGGTSMRVFGTLLSWMQDKTKPVFVVATANNIAAMPPELLRRGRFDEIFFLDLPTNLERQAIYHVHLRKRNRDPGQFDLARLAEASATFVGAEIEHSVVDALYHAFNDKVKPGRDISTDDIAKACERLVPMSRSQRENITNLRNWLEEGRAQSASFPESGQARAERVEVPLQPK